MSVLRRCRSSRASRSPFRARTGRDPSPPSRLGEPSLPPEAPAFQGPRQLPSERENPPLRATPSGPESPPSRPRQPATWPATSRRPALGAGPRSGRGCRRGASRQRGVEGAPHSQQAPFYPHIGWCRLPRSLMTGARTSRYSEVASACVLAGNSSSKPNRGRSCTSQTLLASCRFWRRTSIPSRRPLFKPRPSGRASRRTENERMLAPRSFRSSFDKRVVEPRRLSGSLQRSVQARMPGSTEPRQRNVSFANGWNRRNRRRQFCGTRSSGSIANAVRWRSTCVKCSATFAAPRKRHRRHALPTGPPRTTSH